MRGSGWAGGDPGDGGLRTWSGRERSSHKHRLHARGSTSPALPGPRTHNRADDPGRLIVARSRAAGTDGEGYTVVARRYRPQRFEDVVGQDHVVQALRNAIRLN